MNREKERDRGFQVPEGYFEQLEDRVLGKLENKGIRGFRVPEGYFDDFHISPDSVSPERPVLPINNNVRSRIFWMAAAASILLFFGVKYMNTGNEGLGWDSLDQAELSLWIENDLGGISPEEIAEAYQEVDLEVSIPADAELDEYLQNADLDQILDEY